MQTKSQQERAGKSHYIFKEIYICHEHLLVLNPNQNFKYRWPPSKGGFFHGRDDIPGEYGGLYGVLFFRYHHLADPRCGPGRWPGRVGRRQSPGGLRVG